MLFTAACSVSCASTDGVDGGGVLGRPGVDVLPIESCPSFCLVTSPCAGFPYARPTEFLAGLGELAVPELSLLLLLLLLSLRCCSNAARLCATDGVEPGTKLIRRLATILRSWKNWFFRPRRAFDGFKKLFRWELKGISGFKETKDSETNDKTDLSDFN